MNRKAFIAALLGMISAPFVKKEEPENKLPREGITPEDVEEYVRKEIDRRMSITIKGSDLIMKL